MSLLKGPTPFYSSLRFLHIQQQDPTLVNLINWKNEYSVGVDEIDAQHKNLLDMLNTLLQAIVEKTSKEGMEKVLEEMINYVDFHFKSEEKYTKPHPNFQNIAWSIGNSLKPPWNSRKNSAGMRISAFRKSLNFLLTG